MDITHEHAFARSHLLHRWPVSSGELPVEHGLVKRLLQRVLRRRLIDECSALLQRLPRRPVLQRVVQRNLLQVLLQSRLRGVHVEEDARVLNLLLGRPVLKRVFQGDLLQVLLKFGTLGRLGPGRREVRYFGDLGEKPPYP